MWKALVTTAWSGTGAETDAYHSTLNDDHPPQTPGIDKIEDVTGQPVAGLTPSPNLYVVLVTGTAEYLEEIEADANYLVLAAEEIPDA